MRVCVVGGGLAGLTSAHALVKAGHDVVVREAATRPGGVIGTSHVDGYVREHAASSFLAGPVHGALPLCRELGVAVDKASASAKGRWIWMDGKLHALPSSPLAFLKSDLLSWRGKLALLGEPFRAGGEAARDDESMYAFAERRLGAEAARALVAPFVTGVFAADAHDVSLAAGFPRLAALDRAGGLVRGMLKQHVAARRAKLARPERGMFAPSAGVGALVEALAKELGARIKLVDGVGEIAAGADRGVVVDGEAYDGCVLAVPAEEGAGLVGEAFPALAGQLAGFSRAPVALAYLGYPVDRFDGDAIARGFGFLVAQGEALRVLGVVFESTVWANRAPAGHVLLRCIFGGARDPEATAMDDAALIAQAREDLGKALGARGEPSHASVVRWARGLPRYPVGHAAKVSAAAATARGARIALAGADYRGPGVNDLCADAAVIVQEVAGWK